MAGWYTVKQGESLVGIAARFRLTDWQTIYNHPENESFRQLRPNPHVIFPSDRIYIPDPELRIEDRGTDARHQFQKHVPKVVLRIVLQDGLARRFTNCAYRLEVEGKKVEGRTDGRGRIEQPVPPTAKSGTLTLWTNEKQTGACYKWPLEIAHLDPINEVSGIQARLNNLSYSCGKVDGIAGPRTRSAVREFQEDSEIRIDGLAGPVTQRKLKDAYGV